MTRLLITTALVLPLSAGTVLAQEDPAEDTAQDAGEAAQEAGEAAQEAGDAAQDAAEDTGDAAGDAAQDTETIEVETETTEGGDSAAAEGEAESERIAREQSPDELRVDWITGASVMSPEGDTIGDINDLIMDSETGEMTAAIVGVGGFLGIGEKQIAMSWDSLQIDYDANEITSDITQQEAEEAPEYVFRDQESAPSATGDTGAGGTDGGMGTSGGMGTGGGTSGGVQ